MTAAATDWWFGENPKGTTGETVYRARGIAGRTAQGRDVYVEIELVDFAVTRETADHETIAGYRDLRVRTNGGQDHWSLSSIVEPVPGLTVEQVREFSELAFAWHMGTGETDPCPLTGRVLEWPPAVWYVRVLPAEVEAAVRLVGDRLVR